MAGRRLFRMTTPSGPPVARVARGTAIVFSAATLALVGGVGHTPAFASQPQNKQASPTVASTAATAVAPKASTPTCTSKDMTVSLPTITGVIYTPSGSLHLAPGDSVTVTATAADGYTLAEGTHDWSFANSFDPATCEEPQAVTPEAPTTTTPSCDVTSMTVTLPTTVGVTYTPNGALTLTPGDSVTVTATAKDGYVLTGDATSEWSFTNEFDPSTCTKVVTAEGPSSSAATCDFALTWIALPSVEGVTYTVTGAASQFDPEWYPGVWVVGPGKSATVTASAKEGYVLAEGVHEWAFRNDLEVASCAIIVKATPPTATAPTCSSPFMTVTLPIEDYHGVIYDEFLNGKTIWSDKPLRLRPGDSLTVGAYLDWDWFPFGYIGDISLAPGSGPWKFENTFDPASCRGATPASSSAGVAAAEAGPLAATGAGMIRTEIAWAVGLVLAGGALTVATRKGRRGRRAS